ncbi:L-aspartate oxidase [bacterium]|nr:L-aspartate oxidase [bacterium]
MFGLNNVWDVIIVGSGIAGLYTALNVSEKSKTLIITKGDIKESNSYNAQGGIAAAIGEDDSPDIHFQDTIRAGDGLCNPEAVKILVYSAPSIVEELIKLGVEFDRDETGRLDLGREGAHSRRRVLHSRGDSTGKAIMEVLVRRILEREVPVRDQTMVLELIVEDNICKGVLVWDKRSELIYPLFSKAVVLATGGIGQIYPFTTNPSVACGDGLAVAYNSGAELCDMEFVQFHPTVLKHPSAPSLLITESIRGEGGILRNVYGERFVPKYHEMGELAPRDVVSRIITEEMERTNSDYVYLDITHLSKEFILSHFPMIYRECLKYGIDITKDYIPVAPGAHYMMGGIRTNLKGETCIKGLYACGECAGTGIHGANRMASNSLLEGLVFGKIIAQEVSNYVFNNGDVDVLDIEVREKKIYKEELLKKFRSKMQHLMWKYCGIRREESGLKVLLEELERMQQEVIDMPVNNFQDVETKNMLLLSRLIAESALERKESRGAHFRVDYPYRDDIYWQKHIIKKKG